MNIEQFNAAMSKVGHLHSCDAISAAEEALVIGNNLYAVYENVKDDCSMRDISDCIRDI